MYARSPGYGYPTSPAQGIALLIDTNFGGIFLCVQHALRHMRAAGSGYVLRIWGGFSRRVVGNPDSIGVGAYSVSKVAVRKFTQFVAEDERAACPSTPERTVTA